MRRVLFFAALASAGCVNDYRVRGSDTSSGSTTTGDDDTTTTCVDATCGDETQGGMGDTSTVAGMGDTGGGTFTCEPCTTDDECGDQWDLCVALDEVGPHCLFSCPEAGCPDGLTCRAVLSVDGMAAMQCSPGSLACMSETTTGDGSTTSSG